MDDRQPAFPAENCEECAQVLKESSSRFSYRQVRWGIGFWSAVLLGAILVESGGVERAVLFLLGVICVVGIHASGRSYIYYFTVQDGDRCLAHKHYINPVSNKALLSKRRWSDAVTVVRVGLKFRTVRVLRGNCAWRLRALDNGTVLCMDDVGDVISLDVPTLLSIIHMREYRVSRIAYLYVHCMKETSELQVARYRLALGLRTIAYVTGKDREVGIFRPTKQAAFVHNFARNCLETAGVVDVAQIDVGALQVAKESAASFNSRASG